MRSAIEPHATGVSRATAIVTAAAIVRLIFAIVIPAFPDETYYWDWSRHLAAGYFDHPPVIAWLVRGGDMLLSIFGIERAAVSIRLGSIVAGWIAALATVAIAHRLGGRTGATRAAILITVLPLAAAGLILATPDAPLLATSSVGLYCIVRALELPPRSNGSLRWWTLAGVALGLAFSSKFTSIFLPVGVTLAVMFRPSLRVRLLEPGPYVACVVATLVFLPVLIWNSHHDWIAFVYQLRHGLSAPRGSAIRTAWRHEGDFFGGQAALASPIVFVMLAIAVGRSLRRSADETRYVLAMVATVAFGFFMYSALRRRVEPNWPALAFIPAIVLVATTSWSVLGERWLRAGVALAAVMSLAIYTQGVAPVLPLKPSKDPIARAFGWRELTESAERAASAASRSTNTRTWLGGDRYQEASELAFHADSLQQTFAPNIASRPNQYDLWPRFNEVAKPGDNLVLVLDESDDTPTPVAQLAPHFSSVQRGEKVTLRRRDGEIGGRRLWVLGGWKGTW